MSRSRTIGLVVPSLDDGGGVPAVARFVTKIATFPGQYDVKLISLSMSSCDPESLLLARPRTWFRGARSREATWEGHRFEHVGAIAGEIEFQHYRPRRVLADAVARSDLLQVVCGTPAWANAVLNFGKPVSLQVATRARVERRQRDANPRGLLGWWRKAMTEVTDRLDDRALRRVDAIQVENPWMLDYARRLNVGRDVDIRYAPPGVDETIFAPLATRSLNVDRYVLCVGRLDDPRKNIGLLIEAFAGLPAGVRQNVRLVLAGSSGPPLGFWIRAEELGLRDRVEYVARPSRDALISLYQRANAFALPSDEEGLGMVVLESMACGVPVVSTRSGGPDGVITDGEDGFLVPLDDAQAMASRLGQLLEDPDLNLAMGRKARKTIEARYAERVAGQAFVEVWDRLLWKAGKR